MSFFLIAVAQLAHARTGYEESELFDLQIGINRAFSGGIMTTGLMCVLFGFLNRIQTPNTFIGVSLVIRIIEAFGNSAFLSSSFTMVAKVFPSAVSTMFGVVEMAFGVGMIIGPTVGGALYQVRAGMSSLYAHSPALQAAGYTLPFGVLGGVLLLQAMVGSLTLPRLKEADTRDAEADPELGLLAALATPAVMVAVTAVFSGSVAVGALQATLERHLATFDLSPMQVGTRDT